MAINEKKPKRTVKKVTRKNDVKKEEEKPIKVVDSRLLNNDENIKTLFPTLEGRMLVVKVGNNEYVADDEVITKVETKLNELMETFGVNCLLFVTHHFVNVEIL